MKTLANSLNKARFVILAAFSIGVLGFLLISSPSQAEGEDEQASSSTRRINVDPDACGVSLSLPKFLCRNVDDDNETAEWDKDEIPSPQDDDLKSVTITGTAGKGGGTMTLSILEGGEKIGGKFWKDPQKNEEETELSWNVEPNSSKTKTLYIEGKEWSDEKEDVVLKAIMVCAPASDGSTTGGYDEQIEKTTVYQIDLDIDSENDNGFEASGYSDDEDKKEAYNTSDAIDLTGKPVLSYDSDDDSDGVPHFADGFDLLGDTPLNEDGDASADDIIEVAPKFIPVRIRLEKPFDVDKAEVKFSYEDSVPRLETDEPSGDIRKIDVGDDEHPFKGLELVNGGMRLWTKDALLARDKNNVSGSEGDFVPGDSVEDEWIKWKDLLARVENKNGDRELFLYLEYVDKHPWLDPEDLLKKVKITAREPDDEVECDDDVAVTLLPMNYAVFPPEPTPEEEEIADEDDWEVKTFQVSADDAEFLVQATVLVMGEDEEGERVLLTVEDGSEISWEIDEESSSGGGLSSSTSTTENGLATVTLTTSTTPRDKYKVKAKIIKLLVKIPGQDEVTEISSSEGIVNLRTKHFEVVPGVVDAITIEKRVEGVIANSISADGRSEMEIIATLKDKNGNPAAQGTPVDWHVKGSGFIKDLEYHVSNDEGVVKGTLVAGTIVGTQTVQIISDITTAEENVLNLAVTSSQMVASPASIDVSQNQTAQITLSLQDVSDGAEVSWLTSKGELIYSDSVVTGGQASATLSVSETTIGSARVVAIVGDGIFSCDIGLTTTDPVSIKVDHPVIVSDALVDGSEMLEVYGGITSAQPYFASTQVHLKADVSNAGEWVTVDISGRNNSEAHLFPFDSQTGNQSLDTVSGLQAALSGGAVIQSAPESLIKGAGSLDLPNAIASAIVPHTALLSLNDGVELDFWVYPRAFSGNLVSKTGSYTLSLNAEGYVTLVYGVGNDTKTIVSTSPILLDEWSNITISNLGNRVKLSVNSSVSYADYTGAALISTNPVNIGGIDMAVDHLRVTQITTQLTGITIQTQNLDGQNQVQLDANGEAVFTVSAPAQQQVVGEEPLSQGLDVKVQLAGEESVAKDAIRVSKKGSVSVLYAIAGEVSAVGSDVTDLNREEFAANFFKRAAKKAERAGALPKDLGAGPIDRAKAGYLIAIWMEEQVDAAGEVKHIMKVSAEGLPEPIAKILNLMLAEQMIGASSRSDSEYFAEYMGRQREFRKALKFLSEGDTDSFLRASKLVDGDMAFTHAGILAEQIGAGLAEGLLKKTGNQITDSIDAFGRWFNSQGFRLKMRTSKEVFGDIKRYQKDLLGSLQNGIAGSEEGLEALSELCLTLELIDENGAAAFGVIYGIAKKMNELGQTAVEADTAALAVVQLLDVGGAAIAGDENAKLVLKNLGSSISHMAVNQIPEVENQWDQGNYFKAGEESVDVIEAGAAIKAMSTLLVKTSRRGLRSGRKRDTEIDWENDPRWSKIGFRAEGLTYQRLKAQGYTNITPIRNNSDHGIDFVCNDRKGDIVFIEVKGHQATTPARLSKAQKDMKAFTKSRLERAVAAEGHWKNVSPEIRANAQKILDDIEEGVPFRGIVIDVQNTLATYPRIRFYEWRDGIGTSIPDP